LFNYNKGDNTMSVEYKRGWRWIVWVGGVDDYFLNYKDAKESYDEWIAEGYDFVKLEEITQ
jgi:hypothetical protein|tara:strand:+ start:862 stop:1044 length:183 start_codon:yes stop_codon:yes gene_type:complete